MSVLRWIWNTAIVILAFVFFLFVGLFAVSIVGSGSVWAFLAAAVFAFWMCMVCCVSKPATGRRPAARPSATRATAHPSRDASPRDDDGVGIGVLGGLAGGVGVGATVAGLSAFSDDGGMGLSPHLSGGDLFDSPGSGFPTINPATGLPMVSDSTAGFDVAGNAYGTTSATDSFSSDSFGSSMDFGSASYDSGSSMDFGSASYDSGSSSGSFGSDPW